MMATNATVVAALPLQATSLQHQLELSESEVARLNDAATAASARMAACQDELSAARREAAAKQRELEAARQDAAQVGQPS